jgi:hypothetical protein
MEIPRAALAVGALLSFAAVVAPANADTLVTYDWTTSGVGTSGEIPAGAGTITVDTSTTTTVDGVVGDAITGITGEINGANISGLVAVNGGAFADNDNLLFPTGAPTVLDGDGLAFTETGSSTIFNLWGAAPNTSPSELGPNPYVLYSTTNGELSGTFAITPVPLPASVWLMFLGLGGLGFMGLAARRQRYTGSIGAFAA